MYKMHMTGMAFAPFRTTNAAEQLTLLSVVGRQQCRHGQHTIVWYLVRVCVMWCECDACVTRLSWLLWTWPTRSICKLMLSVCVRWITFFVAIHCTVVVRFAAFSVFCFLRAFHTSKFPKYTHFGFVISLESISSKMRDDDGHTNDTELYNLLEICVYEREVDCSAVDNYKRFEFEMNQKRPHAEVETLEFSVDIVVVVAFAF